MKIGQSAQFHRWIRSVFHCSGNTSGNESQANQKRLEETIEASVVVLAVFAWIAAMTLLP
jgi:hypothetical protein